MMCPWNPSGSHWILLSFHFPTQELLIVDPMCASPSPSLSQTALRILREVLQAKFPGRYNNITIKVPNHSTQNDSISCGVYVCWYTKQMLENKSLSAQMSPVQTRYDIFETVVGHCIHQRGVSNSLQECGYCGEASGDGWIECDRCDQWYHTSCVGVSKDTTMVFFCPQ